LQEKLFARKNGCREKRSREKRCDDIFVGHVFSVKTLNVNFRGAKIINFSKKFENTVKPLIEPHPFLRKTSGGTRVKIFKIFGLKIRAPWGSIRGFTIN
jgi:hypothetical protein